MTVLEGKTVLITGAAGGFGREMTRQFLRAGSFLVLCDRDLPSIHAAAAEVAANLAPSRVAGRVLGYLAADLASEEGCSGLYLQARALAPQIDILVNNAGIGLSGGFADVPQAKWERLMQVNLLAPMRLTAMFLPAMVQRRSGHIVNVSSCAGLVGTPGLVPYSTSKFGLRGFGEALANELAGSGVNVTTIYPFFARTPILNSEQFGSKKPAALPDALIEDPAQIIAELIEGIKCNRPHIYPGPTARRIHNIQRLGPWAAPLITKLMNRGAAQPATPRRPTDVPV